MEIKCKICTTGSHGFIRRIFSGSRNFRDFVTTRVSFSNAQCKEGYINALEARKAGRACPDFVRCLARIESILVLAVSDAFQRLVYGKMRFLHTLS